MALTDFPTLLLARDATPSDEMNVQNRGVSGKMAPPGDRIFAIVAFTSIALYNVIELACIIFTTFKKRRGLYFISFCVATLGIPPYSISFLLLAVRPPKSEGIYGYVTMIVVGWICTVTGQSVVLYSRLHLIDRDKRHLRFVLAMIITNGIILHSVTTVMVFGANSIGNPSRFYKPYSITEKVQVTVFFIQELIISLLYIIAAVNLFRNSALHTASSRARMMWHLIIVNVMVISLDITILALEYANLYKLQTAYKAMSYSIKLKLEFSILNRLVNLTHEHGAYSSSSGGGDHIFDGTGGSNGLYAQSTAFNTTATRPTAGAVGGRKRGSLQAVAEYFAGASKATTGNQPPVPEGVIMRTTNMNVVHHDASEGPMEPLEETVT